MSHRTTVFDRKSVVVTLAVALGLALLPGLGLAQASEESGEAGSSMVSSCEGMREQHQQMQGDMEAANAKLDALLKQIESKHGVARVDALYSTVTELAMQHRALQRHLIEMQPQMMGHMMEHMAQGMKHEMGDAGSGMSGMMESMKGCPMMKDMAGDDAAAGEASEHAKHHPGS